MEQFIHAASQRVPWNKGKLVGQKAPLKLKDIWVQWDFVGARHGIHTDPIAGITKSLHLGEK
jgi:hypothetical protein